MLYVCYVLYAVLYVCVNCFVVCGCAVSGRCIHLCNSNVVSVVNMYLDHLKLCVYILLVYSQFFDMIGLPLHNIPSPGVLMKSIRVEFL